MLHQRAEFIFLEKVCNFTCTCETNLHIFVSDIQSDVRPDSDKVMTHADMAFSIAEGFLLFCRQLVNMGVDVCHIVIFCYQLTGSNFSDSLDSGYIVGRVTA